MVLISTALWALVNQPAMVPHIVAPEPWSNPANPATPVQQGEASLATVTLETLPVKGRAPKTGYNRAHFGDGWQLVAGCDTRNRILQRDMLDVVLSDECKVISGTISDPYTGQMIHFMRGAQTSALVQIDHVVALSNAWQTGAQNITEIQRIALANDPLELLAVDGDANQQKSDGDAATWLPANKAFRCQYVARQIAVKSRYGLWVTPAEKTAMQTVLAKCPEQILPTEK